MGSCFSQIDNAIDSEPLTPQQPQKGRRVANHTPQRSMSQIPHNQLAIYGHATQQRTQEMSDGLLYAALAHVAQFITQRGQNVTVIAVGGAVNTLYIKSRTDARSIDIFGSTLGAQARALLDDAKEETRQKFRGLARDWISTDTQLWMSGHLQRQLTEAALKQNIKIFSMLGLTIYAAPWTFAFSATVDRVLTGGTKEGSHDLDDAAMYVDEYIRAHGNRPVPVATAFEWARQFRHEVTEDILRNQVNQAYRTRFRRDAFV